MSSAPTDAAPSLASARMRRMRDRRRRGYRCVVVETCPRDVAALVRAGFLDRDDVDDQVRIEAAIGALLDGLARRYA